MEPDIADGKKTTFPESRSAVLKEAILAALLGLLLIWAADFSNIAVLHNGAHDSRHSIGFPCH